MAEDRSGFDQIRTRLEDIVTQVRKKDTSLEKSLDLLEEGVKLAANCVELIDQVESRTPQDLPPADDASDADLSSAAAEEETTTADTVVETDGDIDRDDESDGRDHSDDDVSDDRTDEESVTPE